MGEFSIKKSYDKAKKQTRSEEKFWELIDLDFEKSGQNDILIDDFIIALKQIAFDRKSISDGFEFYFKSYWDAAFLQYKELFKNGKYSNLLPTVFLTHHTLELFLKMAKIILFNVGQDKKTNLNSLCLLQIPNTKDLKISNHEVTDLLNDTDISAWFDLIDDGKMLLQIIKYIYDCLSVLTDMKKLAEDARFPTKTDSYEYIDRTNMNEDDIRKCAHYIYILLYTMLKTYADWFNKDKNILYKNYSANKTEETKNEM